MILSSIVFSPQQANTGKQTKKKQCGPSSKKTCFNSTPMRLALFCHSDNIYDATAAASKQATILINKNYELNEMRDKNSFAMATESTNQPTTFRLNERIN